MSKLARALAVGVLLAAMSLGGTAHAQDDPAQPQPAGVTDPDPSQAQPPDEPTPQDPGTPENPGTPEDQGGSPDPGTSPEDPAPSAGPSSTPGPTTTTRPEVIRPKSPRGPVPVRVTPQAAARGTTVRITAEGPCRWAYIWFYDSKADGLTEAGGAKRVAPVQFSEDGTLTASYTLTRRDATGPATFRVVCGIDPDQARDGEASFRVLAAKGQRSGGNGQAANRNDTQLPNRIDTGQGGTADDAAQGGLDPTRLLLPAGLLLIVIGAGLGLHQAARSRR